MSIHQVTKEYVIDLRKSEEERWREVILKESKTAKTLIRSSTQRFLGYDPTSENPSLLIRTAMKFIDHGFRFSGGHYQGELKAWAEAIDISQLNLLL